MADNTRLNENTTTGDLLAMKEVTHGGDTTKLQTVSLVGCSGSEGSYTIADINGCGTYGLDVDVTRSALPSGAATAANQSTGNTALAAIQTAVEVIDNPVSGNEMLIAGGATQANDVKVTLDGESVAVTGTFYQATQPVSLATCPTHAVTQSGTWDMQTQDGSGNALTSATRGSEQALSVQIVDGSGNQVTTFGGSGGTASTDDAAFTAGSGQGTPAMGFYSTDTVDSGDVGVLAMDASRRLLVSIEADNVGIGGGTQYTEGDTDATITGTAMLVEGAGDALVVAPGTAADGLLVNLGSNNDVTVTGTVTANAGTNLNTSALALESGGNLDTIAGDTTSIDGKITACNTGAVVVSSGTITTVSSVTAIANALPAGDNNIGNVDIVTLPADTFVAEDGALGKGVLLQGDDGTDRHNVAVDADGHVQVDVQSCASHAVTNAGTFAVQSTLQTGSNTVGKVYITDGTEDASVNASNQLEVAEASAAAIKTAVEIMDDWDDGSDHCEVVGAAAEDAAVSGAPVLAAGRYDSSERTTDNGDVTTLAASAQGWMMVGNQSSYLFDGVTRCEVKRASGLAASGTVAMVSAVASKKIRVLAIALFATDASANATNVYIANDDNDLIGDSTNPIAMAVDADGDNVAGFVLPWNPGGWFQTDTVNEALNLVLSAAYDIIYAVTYIEVA